MQALQVEIQHVKAKATADEQALQQQLQQLQQQLKESQEVVSVKEREIATLTTQVEDAKKQSASSAQAGTNTLTH